MTPVEGLESLVWDFVVNELGDKDVVEARVAEALGRIDGAGLGDDLVRHESAIRAESRAIDRLVTRSGKTDDPVLLESLERSIAECRTAIEAHRKEVDAIKQKQAAVENREAALRRFREVCLTARQTFAEASLEDRRLLLESLSVRVYVQRKHVRIRVSFDVFTPHHDGDRQPKTPPDSVAKSDRSGARAACRTPARCGPRGRGRGRARGSWP